MVTKVLIISVAKHLQALLRAFPRNRRDTELLAQLSTYICEEEKEI
jgi:hypothetical protein